MPNSDFTNQIITKLASKCLSLPWQPSQDTLRLVSDAVEGYAWVHGPDADGVRVNVHSTCSHRGPFEPHDEPCVEVWRPVLSWSHRSLAWGEPPLPEWRADTLPQWSSPSWESCPRHTHLGKVALPLTTGVGELGLPFTWGKWSWQPDLTNSAITHPGTNPGHPTSSQSITC